MMMKSKTVLKRVAISVLMVLMALFLAYMVLRNNIHEVNSHEFYRSAQLSPSRLKRLIRTDHIRAIINLRGANPQADWYRDELSVSRAVGVQHYDIRLSARHLPTVKQLRRLIELYRTAPKPILIHCQGGADRTGFAASMWLLMHGYSLLDAKRAFSLLYFVHRSDSIGKQVFPIYVHWLQRHHYKTSAQHFLQWKRTTQLGHG